MENKNILMIRHAPMNLKFDNNWYLNQISDDVNKEEVIFIEATSRNKDKEFISQLSPFFVGPVTSSDRKVCKRFENFWQFNKVYEGETTFIRHISKSKVEEYKFICSDENGNPTEDWFKLRDYGFNMELGCRHPYKGKPLYQYYFNNGKVERLDYITSRKKVYIPTYAKLIYNSESFKKLKALVDSGKIIAILDFDAFNYYNKKYMMNRYQKDKEKHPDMPYTLNDYLSINTMKDAVNFPGLLVGHGFVIKMLLQGDIEVVDGEVIDHVGILD